MRLLLLCRDRVGERMAGPGIRYWELAHALARRGHTVTLVAPGLTASTGEVICLGRVEASLPALLAGADAVLTQWVTPPDLLAVQRARVPLVVDAYDPMQLESLESERATAPRLRRQRTRSLHGVQALALGAADAVVCASERQRDLWLGALMALGRLTPEAYDTDPTLRHLVDVVPFGCPPGEPVRCGPGPRELFGLAPDDVVALWGGGVWEWFDPQVVLRAVHRVRGTHPRLKLVLMGMGTSPAATAARRVVDELGLGGTTVFCADGWVPYEQRQSWLLDADAGVSAHADHVETRFAFRTRVLDYFWAGLPCLLTGGDAMADLVAGAGAGHVMPVGDVDGWAQALTALADDAEARKRQGVAARGLADGLRWDTVAGALERVLEGLPERRTARLGGLHARETLRYVGRGAAAVLLDEGAGGLTRRVRRREVFR